MEIKGPVVHVFNSSVVSGPEVAVIPALPHLGVPVHVIFIVETRLSGTEKSAPDYAREFGLSVVEIRTRSRVDREAIRTLAHEIRRLQPSVVHAHDVKASSYVHWASKIDSPRDWAFVSTHHGIFGRPDLKTRLYELFYSHWILPRADRVIAVSRSDREVLLKRGLDPNKVVFLPNGVDRKKVDLSERSSVRGKILESWGVADPGFSIGVVARFSREKRHDRILKVLAELARMEPARPWKAFFFGKGALEGELKELCSFLGLNDRVQFMGYRATIGAEMAGFDLLLSLSNSEGLPISMIEAGWAGTPVFSTAVGGIPELLADGKYGALVDGSKDDQSIAARLYEMLSDLHNCQTSGQSFQERIESAYSRGNWLAGLKEIYTEIM